MEVRAIVFDVDGSVMPQGGPIDPSVASVFVGLNRLGIPMGPSTGKNADYARGLGAGIGVHWNFISAETGAQFLVLENPGPPPVWRQQENLGIGLEDLSLFSARIQLNPIGRTFLLRKEMTRYRPELKEGMLTLFPPGNNLDVSLEWLEHFKDVIHTFQLRLTLKRHSDGCIDVVPDGVNKRLGINQICRLYGCELKHLLTVVDGSNDDELAEGTTPIAVSNAVPKIKEIARREEGFIATLPDGRGFAEGLLFFSRRGMLPKEVQRLVIKHLPEANTKASKP